MPYTLRKRTGAKPWKIYKHGKQIASSTTKAKAQATIRIREEKGGDNMAKRKKGKRKNNHKAGCKCKLCKNMGY